MYTNHLNKLALGTAQFGSKYGVANAGARVSLAEMKRIIGLALRHKILTLDTASGYGDAESRLGSLGLQSHQIVTKLRTIPSDVTDVQGWIFNQVQKSLQNLNQPRVHGLLLHDPKQLLEERGSEIAKGMLALKQRGLTERVGISIYGPSALENYLDIFMPDIVQAPYNLFDQRLDKSGWLSSLASLDVEVHVRSVFLQGSLLMDTKDLPSHLTKYTHLFEEIEAQASKLQVSKLSMCLGFALRDERISKVIIGADSVSHLMQTIESVKVECANGLDFSCDELDLIEPVRWGTRG